VNTLPAQQSKSSLPKRCVGVAGTAAVVACAACCMPPVLAAAGLGSSAVTAFAWLFRPGSELVVGGTAFALTLGGVALRNYLRRSKAPACGASCRADGGDCGRDAATNRV
jgi:hypothetical protein